MSENQTTSTTIFLTLVIVYVKSKDVSHMTNEFNWNNNPCLKTSAHLIPSAISSGSCWGRIIIHQEILFALAPPLGPISFIFMQFLAKVLSINSFCPKLTGWRHPHPGSVTGSYQSTLNCAASCLRQGLNQSFPCEGVMGINPK